MCLHLQDRAVIDEKEVPLSSLFYLKKEKQIKQKDQRSVDGGQPMADGAMAGDCLGLFAGIACFPVLPVTYDIHHTRIH